MRIFSTTALAALAAASLATTADARRVAVDDDYQYDLGGCALDPNLRTYELCEPIDLGFSVGVTFVEDDEYGDFVENFNRVVLYDDGLINLVDEALDMDFGFPGSLEAADWPMVVAQFEEQDFQPLGQFVRKGKSGPDFFEVLWFRAEIYWECTRYDEYNPDICIDGIRTEFKHPPHARLLIRSLPKNSTRFTLSWTEGANAFGYALGTDVRQLGGNGERRFQFVIGSFVPEPASWAMMIAGFGLVGVAARQRRRLSAA